MKTAEVVKSAEGGVLFIDEAYSLAGDQYGTEAVDTLVKEMEDKRDDLVVIVAGYPDPMAIFIAQNPGLASRFRTTIEFADYTDDELVAILLGLAERRRLRRHRDASRTSASCSPRPSAARRSATAGSPATSSRRPSVGTPGGCATSTKPTVEQLRELVAEDLDDDSPSRPRHGRSARRRPGDVDDVARSRRPVSRH